MFIESPASKEPAPSEGAECFLVSTFQVEFRPFERRRRDLSTAGYKHGTPTGVEIYK